LNRQNNNLLQQVSYIILRKKIVGTNWYAINIA